MATTKKQPLLNELDIGDLKNILDGASLHEADHAKIMSALNTLLVITKELEKKRVSLGRLKKMLFGDTSEKTSKVLEKALKAAMSAGKDESKDNSASDAQGKKEQKKPKGHGRNGASKYPGAKIIEVPHESLKPKDPCPKCIKGKVYKYIPKSLVCLRGSAPVTGTVYQKERLRCNLCGEIFTADTPEGVNEEKYDASSGSMISLLKYGTGMPFNRLEQLQGSLGIPLSSSTQWDIVKEVALKVTPALKELVLQAAQGDVLHNDDTNMKILELIKEAKLTEQGNKPGRTGMFTSGIVSLSGGHKIALFFTGRNHAGENIAEVLGQRLTGLSPPIQMCDALSRNVPKEMKTILANCLSHGRRQFVDVAGSFSDEVIHVLKLLKEVYINDDIARAQKMIPDQRLSYHQENSKPWIDKLHQWCLEQLEEHKVEPNGSLGIAISYMLKHWAKLTLFLHEPGAPLDNNICERALKKAIMNRKNSYFYKTIKGAEVGDLFMSLIHTCELCQSNPFDYLMELQKHAQQLVEAPKNWMPWNYKEMLTSLKSPADS